MLGKCFICEREVSLRLQEEEALKQKEQTSLMKSNPDSWKKLEPHINYLQQSLCNGSYKLVPPTKDDPGLF